MNTLEMLESLAESWDVLLTSHEAGPCVVSWTLVIRRDRAYSDEPPFAHTYLGALESVVRRAWAGEPAD